MTDPQNRTGPLVAQLVEGVRADITDVTELLERALGKAKALREHAGGINGLGSTLRAEITKLEQMVGALNGASESVERTLLGTGREPIHERVDTAHLKRVAAAKEAEAEAAEAQGVGA